LALRVFVSVRIDAIPERINATWYKARPEAFSTANAPNCARTVRGKDHSYMPIAVRVVSHAGFNAWVAKAKSRRPN
jgi:cytochrome c oxidase subunit 2